MTIQHSLIFVASQKNSLKRCYQRCCCLRSSMLIWNLSKPMMENWSQHCNFEFNFQSLLYFSLATHLTYSKRTANYKKYYRNHSSKYPSVTFRTHIHFTCGWESTYWRVVWRWHRNRRWKRNRRTYWWKIWYCRNVACWWRVRRKISRNTRNSAYWR